jgi:hypothetical protein
MQLWTPMTTALVWIKDPRHDILLNQGVLDSFGKFSISQQLPDLMLLSNV